MKAINVLSLFDGISCSMETLNRLGIKVDKYYASEIDKYAIEISSNNYPNIIQLGNVCDIKEAILERSRCGDSVGGQVLCVAKGVPVGIGGPLFEGVEGKLSQLLFGIPAVKAVEFGLGTGFAVENGSNVNDGYCVNNDRICTITNNNGGITGGITNGSDIDVRITFKPTPSIFKPQKSVNLSEMKDCTLEIKGRHDPCIVPRAVPCVEAAAAIAVYDALLD